MAVQYRDRGRARLKFYAGAGSWWFRSSIAAPWRPASPRSSASRLGGQHLSGGIKDGGADLGSTEVDDDVDASGLGSARAAMSLGS